MKKILIATIFLVVLMAFSAYGQTVTVDPNTSYQTWRGLRATAQTGQEYNVVTGAYQYPSSTWPNYKTNLFNGMLDLNVTSLRLEIYLDDETTDAYTSDNHRTAINDDGSPSTTNLAGFGFQRADHQMDEIVVPYRQLLAQNGEQLYLVMCIVDYRDGGFNAENTPAEYAEFVSVMVNHLFTKYGIRPDGIELINEPFTGQNVNTWTRAKIAQNLVATYNRLTSEGLTGFDWIVPSVEDGTTTKSVWDDMVSTDSNVNTITKLMSYHRYTSPNSTQLGTMRTTAEAIGANLAMTEHIAADYRELYEDLATGHASLWEQFTLTFPCDLSDPGCLTASEDGGQYFIVNYPTNYNVNLASRSKQIRQYSKYIRRGAVMKGISNSNGSYQGVAFRNPNGTYVVPIWQNGTATVTVSGLPAGTYGRSYALDSGTTNTFSNVTITAGQSVTCQLASAGVCTVYDVNYASPAIYYASPTGLSTNAGTLASPWDLQTALSNPNMTFGDTLYLRGGTYSGKFRSKLQGGTVRSYPGEWAKIDGYLHTTLTAGINSSQTSFSVADTSILVFPGDFGFQGYPAIFIDGENLQVYGKSGANTITNSLRGAGGSHGGAASHSNGADVYVGGNQLYVEGNDTVYRDFELANSLTLRDGAVQPSDSRGNAVHVVGRNNSFINLVMHDGESGIFTSGATGNTLIYGCLSYNNGLYNGTAGLGHGMYLENGGGYSKIYNNIIFNNFNLNTQAYGQTGPYVNGDIQHNTYSGAGSPLGTFSADAGSVSLLIGTNTQPITSGIFSNNYFFNRDSTLGSSMKLGYGAGINAANNSDVLVQGNYFVGGGALLNVENTNKATISGNKFLSNAGFVFYTVKDPNVGSLAWNNNTYYNGTGRTVYGITGTGVFNFANWKSSTSFDASSTETGSNMADTVLIEPNSYTAGRANITIYTPSHPGTINVNFSTAGLTNGVSYVIRNAFNYFGPTVSSFTYNSASPSVSVPLSGNATSVAQPVGTSYTVPTTAPDFFALIIEPGTATGCTATVKYFGGSLPPCN